MRIRVGLFLVLVTAICLTRIWLVKLGNDQKRQLATIELQYEALQTEQILLKAELHRLRHRNRDELVQQALNSATNQSEVARNAGMVE